MFTFIKYISPSWYYNLDAPGSQRYWANFNLLSSDDQALIAEPSCYSSRETVLLDMAYQAWLKGIMVDKNQGLDVENIYPCLKDEYRFLRRHFNPVWGIFVLLIRLFELNNPLREVAGFFSSLKTKRINAYANIKNWKPGLESFDSALLAQNPKVSVIIPTLNRYQYLKNVLEDFEKQDYKNFEVLVVDQSEPFDENFYKPFNLDIKIWYQQEKALWKARNTAIERSEGSLILMSEDDVRFEYNFISSHIKALDFFRADASCGVFYPAGTKIPLERKHFRWSEQFATGNAMVKRLVFEKVGLFDKQFEGQRGGDGEFGLRSYLAGFSLVSNPAAHCEDVKAPSGGLRQMGSWDSWRPKNFFAPRPVPSVLYLTRKYFGNCAAIYMIIKSVFPSVIPYRFKRNNKVLILGSFLALFLLPAISISVIKSWRLASQKLLEGEKVSSLE